MTRPPAIDPHAYARRVDYSQSREQCEKQVAALIAEAVLKAKGRVMLWRRCRHSACGELFRVGDWPTVGHQRSDSLYCSSACYQRAKNRRRRSRLAAGFAKALKPFGVEASG